MATPFVRTAFDNWMDDHAALVDGKWFYGRIAGADRCNEDGSSRQAAIGVLRSCEELHLVPEPSNPFDSNAIKVLDSNGQQVGYLESRLAGEVTRRSQKGIITRAFVSNLSGRPSQTRGLVIGVLTYLP